MKANSVLELIGNTPHVRLAKLFPDHEVWVKLERANPGGSIKDRIALSMIEDAEKKGQLKPGSVIVEPTSGNTGVGLSMVAAYKGYKLILVMPDSMSIERRRLMAAYGANFELTPRGEGMKGAVNRAEELVKSNPNAWMPQQFENPANVNAHRDHTAKEILADFPNGFDYLITGVGTGGHISGVGEILKGKFPKMKVLAVEPAASPVIAGGPAGPHPLQGLGANFVPKNLHRDVLDGLIHVQNDESFEFARRAAKEEGLFIGISSGAALAGVAKALKEKEIAKGSKILTFNFDTGERYLSVDNLF